MLEAGRGKRFYGFDIMLRRKTFPWIPFTCQTCSHWKYIWKYCSTARETSKKEIESKKRKTFPLYLKYFKRIK